MNRNTLARRRTLGARHARTSAEGGGGAQGAAEGGNGTASLGEVQNLTVTPPASQQAGEWDGKVESLPEGAQKIIREAREGEAKARTNAKASAAQEARDALAQEIGKALGLIKDGDQAPDPAKLTEQLTAAQQAQRQTAVELAVYRTAGKHTADPDALLDSRSFLNAVAQLDPTATDFGSQVDAAIKAAVDGNPKLKTIRTPGASGADHTGGSGEGPRTPQTLEEAIALKMAH